MPRHSWLLMLATAAVLLLTVDTGVVGRIADGRQMIFTAVAITETGTIGQARGRDLTVPRAEGDSVSRYGLAMSFVQVPAAAIAPSIEETRGPGSSQSVFLVAPFALVIACGWFAMRAARQLGGGAAAQRLGFLLATIASPFGVYAAMELSEPLQAFALIGAFSVSLTAASAPNEARRTRAGILAGALAGLAVLTKSNLLVVAPFTLLPLLRVAPQRRARTIAAVVAGFVPLAALWLYFEIARFGRPFAGYAGEGFTHPFLDGAWRLIVGSNKGLLLYFPAAIAGFAYAWRRLRRDRGAWPAILAACLPTVALLLLAAPWWAWHGVDGWGPRLLVPGVPLLAVLAALDVAGWRALPKYALLGMCFLINVPPLVQHPTPVVRYMWSCAWPTVDQDTASRVPRFARREIDGRIAVPPDQILASIPSASPFLLLPWFRAAAHQSDARAIAERLDSPPWLASRPDIRPSPPLTSDEAWNITHPSFAVYDQALIDQILRAQHLRDTDHALALSQKLERLAPSGFADALLLESFRLQRRKQDAVDWLTHLSIERRTDPAINVVLALWDRDDGKTDEARALIATSAPSYPAESPVRRAANGSLATWPSDLASMLSDPSVQVETDSR